MNREICGQCGQSLDPNWIDERIPKLESMLREAVRERDSLRQYLHDEHQRHVGTMDERSAVFVELAAAQRALCDHLESESAETMRADKAEADLAAARAENILLRGQAKDDLADLAAVRALLLEARGWLDPWESRQSALRDRINAALAKEKK